MTRPRRTVRAKEDKPRGAADDAPEAMLVRMLGGFEVSIGSHAVEKGEWRLKKAAALVKLLALSQRHRMHRDQVMSRLWPELDQRAAANNLNYALHVARRILDPAPLNGPRYLCLDDEVLALFPEGTVWVDVEAFEEATATARRIRQPPAYRAALEVYGGDLLPADLYESWTEDRREEVRGMHLALLVELAGLHEEREELEPAIEVLQRVAKEEPAHEEARAGLMRLHALSGRQAEALKQYERLEKVLSREYAARPAEASRRLYGEITAGRFPPARSLPAGTPPAEARRHNLPIVRTSFIGRERELAEIKQLLSTTRLLTLTGSGGCGKTRLALEAARGLVGAYPDGVWLVSLASLSDPELVPQEVAEALDMREQPNRPLVDTLVDVLSVKKMLLMVDNCEHLVDAVAHLIDTLLGSCPDLRILATSREALDVAGEAVWVVPSLSLPDSGRELTVEELSGYESTGLFVERARRRDTAFIPAPRDVPGIVEICRRLDGIPLAIELAAARVGALAVEQISERLEDSLKLLTTGGRTATPRHKTLRGALDWSYELLSEPEKILFRRLSVFAGGWTLEAVEAVGAGEEIEEGDVLDLLSRLVDKSLVVAKAEEGAPRYRLLEPVRQYAWEKLEGAAETAARPGEAGATRERHSAFFLELAEEADKESDGPGHVAWLRRLETEHDNLRAALGWALGGGDDGLGLRLAGALWLFWLSRGHLGEGRKWLETSISRGSPGTSYARAKALKAAGWLALYQDEYEAAKALLKESLDISRGLKDEEGIASSLTYLGFVAVLGDRDDIPVASILEEAVGLKPELEDRRTVGNLLVFEGLVAASRGDLERAAALHEESLALFREMRDPHGMVMCLNNLGFIALAKTDFERASTAFEEGLRLARELDHKVMIQYSFLGLAAVATSRDRPARAARIWGAAEGVHERYGIHLTPLARSRTNLEDYLAAARSRLDEATFEAAWAEGKAMAQREAIEYALSEEEPTPPAALASPPHTGKHNLPVPRSSFVGRERELVEVERRLAETRLLTLTGAGGSGKTRLALKVAENLVGVYRDGVWLVEFAPLSEGELVPKVVAGALKVREQQDRPLVETLLDALRGKETLLVLDNCEHLLDAVATLVDKLLGACPGLEVLATSREALGVAGEANWPVPPLSLPKMDGPSTAEELTGHEATRLFVERARYRTPAFMATGHNARAVAEVCRRLDGIPLAIELAAARVGVLSVEQISERLGDSLKLLTGGGRTAQPRHRTLRAALDWSFDLLDEEERRLFERLSVFAGGFMLEAAEAVGAEAEDGPEGEGRVSTPPVLDLLGRLVDKSLVMAEAGEEGSPRYKILEPVRQYAQEKLEGSGEAATVRISHAEWYLALAEEAEKGSAGPGHASWLHRLETEHDNLRAAVGWSLEEGDAGLGLRLAGALWLFWFTQGYSSEGWGWLEKGLSFEASPAARAKALSGAGWISMFQGDTGAAKKLLEESVILYRELKDEEGLASSLNYLGYVALIGGREDVPVAALLEEALALKPRIKSRHTMANTLVFAALDALLLRGDWEETVALHEEALALFREMDDRWGMGLCLTNLGLIVAAMGHHARATRLLQELMHRSRELGDKFGVQYSFFGLACVADSKGHTARAARLWGVSEAVREVAGLRLPHAALSVMKYESRLTRARAALGEAAFERAWAEGKAMTPEEATRYVLMEEEASPSTVFAPAPPTPNGKHNLPVPKSSFVGREKELLEVERLFSTARLLTLTGAGGSGKTRLALALAGGLVGAYPDGVWFVELAPLSEPGLVPQAVAEALGVREQPNRSLVEILVDALREKEILLVLDNCEHLVDAAARLTDTLLGSCPGLEVLATSREALRVTGEANWPVPPLSLPQEQRPLAVEELAGYESTRLLVERARGRDPAFVPTERNAQAVVEICKRLDGIPLAIELAAARVGLLSVEQISERLENSLKLLTAGDRTVAPRHQTLRGVLDWSYELLTEPEKKLFGRLSVLVGGWTLEAAEAVGAGNGIEKDDVLDLLGRLVDKSLVESEAPLGVGTLHATSLRYKMLEPVRQYGREKLEADASPGEAEAARSQHAIFFLTLAEEADKESDGPGQVEWLRRLETEHDNLRAALGWSLEEGNAGELGLRLAGALWLFWFTRGHLLEGRGWLESGVSLGHSLPAKAKALNGAGWITIFQGDLETAKTLLEESLALYRELEDEEGIASSLNYLGFVALLGHQEDIPVADLLEEALALKPRIRNRRTIANTLVFAALDALLLRGDHDEAVALHEEALTLFREIEDKWGITMCLINLGLIAAALGHHARATALLRELMHLSRELDYKFGSQYSFFGLACIADSEGRTARATLLWGVSEAIREAAGLQLPSSTLSVMRYESRLADARARLGEAAFDEAWAEGKAMMLEEATKYALSEVEPAPLPVPTSEEPPTEEPPAELTRREEEVAALVARGLTNRQIARELTLSRRTIDNHVGNVLKKLQIGSRSQVAAWLEKRSSSPDQG